MLMASLSLNCLLIATYGVGSPLCGVIKIEQWKNEAKWHVVIYHGGPDNRQINPALISHLEVDGNARDPLNGRLLIDEMRELLKSRELVMIHLNWIDQVPTAIAVQKHIGLKLNLQESLP